MALIRSARAAVVDDDEMVRDLLSIMLGDLGYQAIGFASAEAALQSLEMPTFDVILFDMKMRSMDGAEFYARVEARFPQMTPRMVLVTGDHWSEAVTNLLERTGVRHLRKPFRQSQLAACLVTLHEELGEDLLQLPKVA